MLRRVLLSLCLLVVWQTNAHAVHNINVCGETCDNGEQCNMIHDLTCSNDPAVTIAGGADLDFKGYKITCSGCESTQSMGVKVTAANSTIEDTVGGGGVRNYPIGIYCSGANNSLVRNVHVDGNNRNISSGIVECRKVTGAVVTGVRYIGISNWDIGDSDYIKDSYIMGSFGSPGSNLGVQKGIWLEGDGSGLIDHNIIGNTTDESILAVYVATDLEITDNILYNQTYGSSWIFFNFGTPPVISGNVCGDPNSTAYNSGCFTCVDTGGCGTPSQPLDIP